MWSISLVLLPTLESGHVQQKRSGFLPKASFKDAVRTCGNTNPSEARPRVHSAMLFTDGEYAAGDRHAKPYILARISW